MLLETQPMHFVKLHIVKLFDIVLQSICSGHRLNTSLLLNSLDTSHLHCMSKSLPLLGPLHMTCNSVLLEMRGGRYQCHGVISSETLLLIGVFFVGF